VAADADLDVAAHRIVWGKHLNAGQTCIAPDYVLVDEQVRDELVDRMVGVVREFLGEVPAASVDYSRIVNDRHYERLTGLVGSSGATVVSTAEPDPATRFFPPTLLVEPDPASPVMQEEIFGPLLPVLGVPSVDEAVRFVNDRPKPLALYVFAEADETVERILAETSSGGACVNHTLLHITPSNLPFGGVGPSGMGQYHGKAGFDVYSHHKSVLVRTVKPELSLMYPPYTRLKDRIFRRVM
jgi:aldehyde dehydrogenase (NAD+)